jgi:xanthine dehydrogenase accessory factor
VACVQIVETRGSAPRDAGTAMYVWGNGQTGTIGGGALELTATRKARARLTAKGPDFDISTHVLGPDLGQCCGGVVTLRTDIFRSVEHVYTRLTDISKGTEPFLHPPAKEPLWIFGSGHVGRALVAVLAPLHHYDIIWVDTARERFPEDIPDGASPLVALQPDKVVTHAPKHANHLIMTYSHEFDLAICHAVLNHGFASAGLIGSHTKWARFRTRLQQLGHSDAQIARISCPIGDPGLGKHPQAIAVGVAAALLTCVNQQASVQKAAI